MFHCSEFHLGRYNCARKIKYVVKQVSLFVYYLLAYFFRDAVRVADGDVEWWEYR